MNRHVEATKYKIPKGQEVNIVSTQDRPVILAQDEIIRIDQVTFLRDGEVMVKLHGFRFIAHQDQLRPQESRQELQQLRDHSKPSSFGYGSTDSSNKEPSGAEGFSGGRSPQGAVSFLGPNRPKGSGRVQRSKRNWN